MKVLFNKKKIQAMVKRMAQKIIADAGQQDIVLIILLKGACWFGVDLSRAIERCMTKRRKLTSLKKPRLYTEFMRVSSYEDKQESSGVVRIEMDIQRSIKGKKAIIVDDVADTRQTLAKVRSHLLDKEPSSLKIAVAVDKTSKSQRPELKLDYVGFANVENWLVGYGMDYQGIGRALEEIRVL